MGMEIYQNYSQFYTGTEKLKSYGSNSSAQKDTLVKYEFNTTDKDGNKIMDKMSKEETMKAMNEISAQYGDNVIVQFSGDGLAALVEGPKGTCIPQPTEEQLAAKAEKDAAFLNDIVQNEHVEVAEEHIAGKIDYNKIMHEKSPEVAREVDDYLHEFGRTKDQSYMAKAAKLTLNWFLDNYSKHSDWFEVRPESKTVAADNGTKLSSKAQKLLKELSKKYGNMDFLVGSSKDMKSLMANSKKEYSVLFSAEELEKMASDDSYRDEMLGKINRLVDFSNRINREFGFVSNGNSIVNSMVSKYGLALNEDGKVSLFAELTDKSGNKPTTLQASSEDELIGLIRQYRK
ncbi:MAG: hypothetical protein K2H41_09895 [Acetatifactor sp.]|nr:hypothetical protein [Acetatifactor sp.]